MTEAAERWQQACLAQDLLLSAPGRLKGLVLRARAGPVRDAWLARLSGSTDGLRKLHPTVTDDVLFGGVDLAATLGSGHVVRSRGLVETPGPVLLTMAERCPNDLAARLAQILDADLGHCLVALDEGAEADERCPAPLAERLAFHVDLDGLTLADVSEIPPLRQVSATTPVACGDAIAPLTALAARFGIDSLRAPLLALAAAQALARIAGRHVVSPDDIAGAATLVYPSRATCMPQDDEQVEEQENAAPPPAPDDTQNMDEETDQTHDSDLTDIPQELLIEAVRALLPEGLLDQVVAQAVRGGAGSGGAGHRKKGNRRGRPLPSRPGRLDGRARIDLVATLRAAAPWQKIRAATAPQRTGLHIRMSDIRVKRFEDRSDRLLIFAVDASGSAAMARLGEAKGAVELLLAEAYSRRDHVALVSFRGDAAELLLPPTRSLVQTKRRLAGLPGGGGTPLAAGLRTALDLGVQSRGKGLSPTVALLTDGRANIALDGSANRQQAGDDAEQMGRCLRAEALPAILLDTGNRPTPSLRLLADIMDAPYLPLPRANAERISTAVSDALA